MSSFRQRNREALYSNSAHQRDNNSRGDGGCYAVANVSSSVSGIYFSHDQVTKKILEMRSHSGVKTSSNSNSNSIATTNIDFRRFDKIRDAEAFMMDRGFSPKTQVGSWVSSRNKNPIFYTPSEDHSGIGNNCTTDLIESNHHKGYHHHQLNDVMPNVSSANKDSRGENNLQRLWSDHKHGTNENEHEHEHEHGNSLESSSDLTRPFVSIDSSPKSIEPSSNSKMTSWFFQPGGKRPAPPKQQRQKERKRERVQKRQRQQSVDKKTRDVSSESATSAMERLFAAPLPDFDNVQQEAVNAAMNGFNVFVTGVAGTGKSLVTKVRSIDRRSEVM